MEIGGKKYKRGPGHIISFIPAVTTKRKFDFTVKALSSVSVKALEIDNIVSVMNKNRDFNVRATGAAMMYLRYMKPEASGPLVALSEIDMSSLIQ